jgi:uroporphyrinogen-III synthase
VRVAVTGTDERLAERLRAAGFEVVATPLIRIEEIDGPPIEAERYEWILVTSRNAVEPLLRRLRGRPGRIAAIGPGTAEALSAYDIEPDLVAERSTQEGIAEELPKPPGRILHAAAEGARDVLVRELGAELVPLYRTIGPVTSAEARDAGLEVVAEADSHDLDGLVAAVKLAASHASSSPS